MNLNTVHRADRNLARRVRRGKGTSSGAGKTSGRGQKGQGARQSVSYILYFEGGQMPLARKLPKRGFNNRRFQAELAEVPVGRLDRAFRDGETVTLQELKARGIVPRRTEGAVMLGGGGELNKKLAVRALRFSESAKAAIEKAGGSAQTEAPIPRRKRAANVPLDRIHGAFKDGDVVDPAALQAAGIVRAAGRPIKIVRGGHLKRRLTIKAHAFSRGALDRIRLAGGEAILLS